MVSQQEAQYGHQHADGGFREFALSVYQRDGAARAGLSLQDRRGVDVNVLLFAAYVGARCDQVLSRADVEVARRRTDAWQSEVVAPLRAVRRRLKTADEPGCTDLRTRVQEAELAAEFIELDELATLAAQLGPGVRVTNPERVGAALDTVVAVYVGAEPTADDRGDIAALATATVGAL